MNARTRDAIVAAAVAAAALGLYVTTLQPDFGGPEDTPKFQFVGYVLGTPHPPGYPLYVLLTHAFSFLPIGTIAYRANLFSAVMAAAACALAYVIGRQLEAGRWAAMCAALGLATGASFWRSAVFAEVYSLAAAMAALTIVLLLAWGARGGTGRLLAAFGAFAIGLGNHLTIVGLVPAFAIYVLTRGRRVWSVRLVAGGALLLAIGLGQYGLILMRTRQGAPYLEIRAEKAADLVGVVTAERYADQRFAFTPAVLFREHLPVTASLIALELGAAAALCVVGAAAGLGRANVGLVLGAAAGLFFMILNLSGDLKGFITPLIALLWPLVAVAIDRVYRAARSIPRAGRAVAALVLAAAILLPVRNIAANHATADRSAQSEEAQFLRAVFSQLPRGAGFIAENYWADMAWTYYTVTGEAAGNRQIARVGFDAPSVRRAAGEGHRVFGFAAAATFLAGEGLQFRRTTIEGMPLTRWLASLPRGSVLAGATARASFPANLAAIGHAELHPGAPARAFEVFAAVAGRPGGARRAADEQLALDIIPASLSAALPAFAGALTATAGVGGARLDLAGRTIARAERGVVLAVFAPDGTLVRTLEWPPGAPPDVPYGGAVYELAGSAPCATVTDGGWADISAVLAGGSWAATFASTGSIAIEMTGPEITGVRTRSAVLMGDGAMQTAVASTAEGDILTTTLTRSGESRPIFRLALDKVLLDEARGRPSGARARLRAGGARRSLQICAFSAVRPLLEAGRTGGVLRADFESEAYFGAGWSDAQHTATGPVRRGEDGATLFLPLERGVTYRLLLDLAAAAINDTFDLGVTLNGVPIGACHVHADGACELVLPGPVVAGINTVRLSRPQGSPSGPMGLVFREARIQIQP